MIVLIPPEMDYIIHDSHKILMPFILVMSIKQCCWRRFLKYGITDDNCYFQSGTVMNIIHFNSSIRWVALGIEIGNQRT